MPFHAIHGTFHATGFSPDEDSIKFKAADDDSWLLLEGQPARLTRAGMAQLRLEGIDAVETHYRAGSKNWHQPLAPARAATDRLLELAGIRNVVWTTSHYSVRSSDDGTPGFILSRTTERYRRPVAFAFAGECPWSNGDEVRFAPKQLRRSINYRLLAEGHAYPTFYSGLFYDLRDAFTRATQSAQRRKRGVWRTDRSTCLKVSDPTDPTLLTDTAPIYPKLFRRLMRYFANTGTFDGFAEYLLNRRETTVLISKCHFTHFDNVIDQKPGSQKITEPLSNLLFIG
jgi:endonuclease YncB( thermonuclease family)